MWVESHILALLVEIRIIFQKIEISQKFKLRGHFIVWLHEKWFIFLFLLCLKLFYSEKLST